MIVKKSISEESIFTNLYNLLQEKKTKFISKINYFK